MVLVKFDVDKPILPALLEVIATSFVLIAVLVKSQPPRAPLVALIVPVISAPVAVRTPLLLIFAEVVPLVPFISIWPPLIVGEKIILSSI